MCSVVLYEQRTATKTTLFRPILRAPQENYLSEAFTISSVVSSVSFSSGVMQRQETPFKRLDDSSPAAPATSAFGMQQALTDNLATVVAQVWQLAPQIDHPLSMVFISMVSMGIYIASEPIRHMGTWALPCPILSSILGLHS
jgi:hypothetical protein